VQHGVECADVNVIGVCIVAASTVDRERSRTEQQKHNDNTIPCDPCCPSVSVRVARTVLVPLTIRVGRPCMSVLSVPY